MQIIKKTILFFLFVILFKVSAIGNNGVLDSLLNATKQPTHQLNDDFFLLYAKNLLNIKDFSACKVYVKKGLALAKKAKNIEAQADLFFSLGQAYSRVDSIQLAYNYISTAKKMTKTLEGKRYYAGWAAIMAVSMGDYREAVTNFIEEIKVIDKMRIPAYKVSPLSNLSELFMKQKQYDKALHYAEESLAISKKHGSRSDLVYIYCMLGQIYEKLGKTDSASLFLRKSVDLVRTLKPASFVAPSEYYYNRNNAQHHLSKFYLNQKQYEKALIHADTSVMDIERAELQFELAKYVFTNLAQCHLKVGNFAKSQQAIQRVESLMHRSDYLEFKPTYYQYKYDYALAQGEYRQAILYRDSLENLEDELRTTETEQYILYAESEFRNKEKQAEIELLREQQLNDALRLQQQRYITLAVLCVLALFIFALLFLYRERIGALRRKKELERLVQKRTGELEQANTELRHFNYILSHDLKEPIRSIVSFSTLLQRKLPKDDRIQDDFQFIIKGGRQLQTLINDVNEFHTLSQKDRKRTAINLNDLVREVLSGLHRFMEEKNAVVQFSDLPKFIYANHLLLFSVFKNLIENGIKYNQSDAPMVQIFYQEKDNFHYFTFSDNGIGIDMAYKDKIFEMFRRLHNREKYEGTGLGLAITKKLIEREGGTIDVTRSQTDVGTTFEVRLPKFNEPSGGYPFLGEA